MATCVVVFGYGQVGQELNAYTRMRVDAAARRINELVAWGEQPYLILTSGSGTGDCTQTMALDMFEYLSTILPANDFRTLVHRGGIIVNQSEPHIWGTIRELAWAYERAREIDDHPALEFVTNARHGKRVLLTNRMLTKIPQCTIVESGDPPSIMFHEVLGYGKLLLTATRATKLIGWVEGIRRKYYSAG